MATYYLNADTGNDTTGSGTSGSPWLTISKAHASASSGDTIICQDATATYSFTTQIFTKNLTIRGLQDDASGAVFNGGDSNYRWHANFSTTVQVAFDRLTFENITTAGAGTYQNILGFLKQTTTNCVFRNIINSVANGGTSSPGIVGPEYLSGVQDTAITVQNCLFYNLSGGSPTLAIALQTNGGNDTGYMYWYNNTVYADGSYSSGNFFAGGGSTALDYQSKNNIFYCTSSVAYRTGGSNPIFSNNDTYNVTSVPSGTGNITSDPLFVDSANDNFNLRPTSPCIDTGVLL